MDGTQRVEKSLTIPADFETAIKACGFGRFNILLLLAACPAIMSAVMETAVISYILPSAECDLNLNLVNKGILNAISYAGMIVSAVGWGYLSDSKGRNNILVWGYLLHFLSVLFGSMSQNVEQLMVAKFFSGFIVCGPFSTLFPYMTEFHGQKHRAPIMMVLGALYASSAVVLPLLAVLILPNQWNFSIFNMKFSAWKIFLAVCGIPSLLAGIFFSFFPESPRFLMIHGKYAEALQSFKTIYAINAHKPKDTYPILELMAEVPHKTTRIPVLTNINSMADDAVCPGQEGSKDESPQDEPVNPLKALFAKPYIGLSILVCLLNFCVMWGSNTMRLWLPQMFASLHEYEQISAEASSMCTILEYSVNKTEIIKHPEDECVVVITSATYTNNLIVAGVILLGFLVAGSLINALGDKWIQVLCLSISGTCGLALYWSSSVLTTIIVTSMFSCLAGIATSSCIGISSNLFPTSSRSMMVTLSLTFGRIGTIVGNVLFPLLMTLGCIPPIIMIGGIMYFACLLAFNLPATKKAELK